MTSASSNTNAGDEDMLLFIAWKSISPSALLWFLDLG
jgi:hypothetical protein